MEMATSRRKKMMENFINMYVKACDSKRSSEMMAMPIWNEHKKIQNNSKLDFHRFILLYFTVAFLSLIQ